METGYFFKIFPLKVEKGEFLSITGESGAGKTTLLNMMGLLEQPDRGNIILFGRRNLKFHPGRQLSCGAIKSLICSRITD